MEAMEAMGEEVEAMEEKTMAEVAIATIRRRLWTKLLALKVYGIDALTTLVDRVA